MITLFCLVLGSRQEVFFIFIGCLSQDLWKQNLETRLKTVLPLNIVSWDLQRSYNVFVIIIFCYHWNSLNPASAYLFLCLYYQKETNCQEVLLCLSLLVVSEPWILAADKTFPSNISGSLMPKDQWDKALDISTKNGYLYLFSSIHHCPYRWK